MKKFVTIVAVVLTMMLVVACSSNKNTGLTRRVQAFKALYNTYYNGHLSFREGEQAQRTGNKDNYMEVLPVFITGNKATTSIGKSNYDRAIEKCQKAIKQHSITKRPEWKSSKPKSQKDKLWLSRKEYNPFLYKAWFLMGESQFRKGEYMEAASTFAYMQRLYYSDPDIVAKARLQEAKCYAEMEWFYDAENLVNQTSRDSFPSNLEPLKAAVLADCQVRQELYEEAIPNVRKALKQTKGTIQKARLHYLLGQLYHATGQDRQAFKEYKKVYSMNPPYELAFNARIQQTEVMSKGQSKAMIRKLEAMARNSKNKDYLDQVYYAIGNIWLAQGDTLKAIYAYNDGVEKSIRNGLEKGVVWLHLGQLYWDCEQFVKAQACYAGALGLFDKERDDYKTIDERAKILEELLPYASAVELQDSLQALARMDSLDRLKVIDKMIEELKKKEKEEARKNAENQGGTANNTRTQTGTNAANTNTQNRGQQTAGLWYFYNPASVDAGKKEFQKKWGERELADDWRRKNKTVLADFNDENAEANDSVDVATTEGGEDVKEGKEGQDGEMTEEEKKQQEYENDPHRREYYLKDIPFTDEQMAASNAALVDGLYNSAVIYKDRMENFPLAERTFQRVLLDFPEFEHVDETYYNLFQLYSRTGRVTDAEDYKRLLVEGFPENEHAILVSDPNFEFKGRYGKQIEDSLYQEAYNAFHAGNYDKVIANNAYTEKEYPKGENRARFLFLDAMSRLEKGERQQFMGAMKAIVEKYPKSTVSELAGLYVKGLQDGRILASGRMDMGSIWDRRMGGMLFEGDSLSADTVFLTERNTNFLFVIAYEHDSINENQLLFEVARYNFTSFAVRNFDINIDRTDGIDMLQVKMFNNYEEAYVYLHRLLNDEEMAYKLEGLHPFIISEDNLQLLLRGKSFGEYFEFYDENFDRVGHLRIDENSLDEPTEILDPEEMEEMEESEDEEYEDEDEVF